MRARVLLFGLLTIHLHASTLLAKLVACVGDSITYGSGISDRLHDSYPAQLERILQQFDAAWEVENFGVSGATLLRNGDRPYVRESAYQNAQASDPNVVIIKLGTNDSKPQNWAHKGDFVLDCCAMIDVFRALPGKPQVWICKPVPAFRVNLGIRPEVIADEILPMIDEIAQEKDVPVIDLYTTLLGAGHLFPDGIHPNAEGAGLMAEAISPFLLGVRLMPDFNHDGVLTLVDFAMLAQRWLQNEPSLDIAPPPNGDAAVAYLDLAGLGKYWMKFPGLVAHWKLDERGGEVAADRLGRLNGEVHGSLLWQSAGVIGGALGLDGVDDYVSAGGVLNPADGPFTVFAWVKGGQPGQTIVSQSNQFGTGEIWLGTDASTGAVMTSLTDGSRITRPLVSEAGVTDGFWHRVRLVWGGSHRYLFVDAKEVTADTRELNDLKSSTAGFYFGAGKDLEPGSFWAGLIDDIRFYSRAVRPWPIRMVGVTGSARQGSRRRGPTIARPPRC